jgi:hypothetical protein
MPSKYQPRTKVSRTITLPSVVDRLLVAAAARRRASGLTARHDEAQRMMTAEELASQIIGGVITRLSIDKAVSAWGAYRSDVRALDAKALDRSPLALTK